MLVLELNGRRIARLSKTYFWYLLLHFDSVQYYCRNHHGAGSMQVHEVGGERQRSLERDVVEAGDDSKLKFLGQDPSSTLLDSIVRLWRRRMEGKLEANGLQAIQVGRGIFHKMKGAGPNWWLIFVYSFSTFVIGNHKLLVLINRFLIGWSIMILQTYLSF